MTQKVQGNEIRNLKTSIGELLVPETTDYKLIKNPLWLDDQIMRESETLIGKNNVNPFDKIESIFDTLRIVKV